MKRSVPQIQVPSRCHKTSSIEVPQLSIPRLSVLQKSKSIEQSGVDDTDQPHDAGDLCNKASAQNIPLTEDNITASGDHDSMSDGGTYCVIIDDTLSADSSCSSDDNCTEIKTEKITYHNEDKQIFPNQILIINQCGSPVSALVTNSQSVSGKVSLKEEPQFDSYCPETTQQHFSLDTMSSIELEGDFVDQAINSVMTLPQVFTEVVEMQKGQTSEIQHQQHSLQILKKKYEIGINESKEVKNSIVDISCRISIAQKAALERTKDCDLLQHEIVNLVSICQDIQQAVQYKQEEYDMEKRKVESYHLKMNKYKTKVAEEESKSPLMCELQLQHSQVRGLQDRKINIENDRTEYAKMMNGILESETNKSIRVLEEKIHAEEDLLKKRTVMIDDVRRQQEQVQKSILVLNKRNTAQLTRLKRQSKEVHIRRRRWNEQISHLEKAVAELNKKLKD